MASKSFVLLTKCNRFFINYNKFDFEDLFHVVWKDEYYSKNSSTITVHIRHLREKLKDTSDNPQYIKTIWGVGYKI